MFGVRVIHPSLLKRRHLHPSHRAAAKAAKPPSHNAKFCDNCGRAGHLKQTCHFLGNDKCNSTNHPWAKSPMGLWWKSKGHQCFNSKGEETPSKVHIQEQVSMRDRDVTKEGGSKPKFVKKKDFKNNNCKSETAYLSSIFLKSSTEFLPVSLTVIKQTEERKTPDITDQRLRRWWRTG